MNGEFEEVLEDRDTPHGCPSEPEITEKSKGLGKRTGIRTESEFCHMSIRVPVEVAQYIKNNGGGGFVSGLVRSVMR